MSKTSGELRVIPVPFPREIKPGDALVDELANAIQRAKLWLEKGDILVVKHKIVSKAEGQLVELGAIRPSASARRWGERFGVDARVTEVAVRQAKRVVRRGKGVLITETRHGLVCANSGVDVSNVDGGRHALLLPEDPDRSAQRLYRELKKRIRLAIPVIISDSFGRPWREGLTEVAIGVAGMKAIDDYRGRSDPHGYRLRASVDAVADELACAAGLVCGKLARTPACIIRGFRYQPGRGQARDLIRPPVNDLFR
ncbi:MAG: coenzyme F420-0:L-glutamate ligase [Acidobacteria bacterium]|nr:MAG: coenzyme F420-0:L-glutamate ligase [Acidobacteriota bacterium]